MCCLFGILNYSGETKNEVNTLINALAQNATLRGMDSTGIAYNKDDKLKIYKKPLCAYDMQFKGLENCISVSGHTRHATQGSEKKNYNNHPFMGYCDNAKFALSHNGVLWNDKQLRKKYNIEANRIETDSYIAVQLLEYFNDLNSRNIAKMAEAVSGSFSFSITDTNDSLWLIKGDSPLAIVHLPDEKLYIYASTKEILYGAIAETDYIDDISSKNFEVISIKAGDIMQITKDGSIITSCFDYDEFSAYGYDWRSYGNYTSYSGYSSYSDSYIDDEKNDNYPSENNADIEYLNDLKSYAMLCGYTPKEIDELIADGWSVEEIEDWIYSDYTHYGG